MDVPEIYTSKYWGKDSESNITPDIDRGMINSDLEMFSLLTIETADMISRFIRDKTVVEVFAGSGFLAHHLRALSGLSRKQYKAYDNYSEGYPYKRTRIRYPGLVTKANAFKAPIKKADVIIMSWPDFNVNNAARIAKKMVSGQYLLYCGEGEGGCTGDDRFFDILEEEFVLDKFWTIRFNENHLQALGYHDEWCLYKKV